MDLTAVPYLVGETNVSADNEIPNSGLCTGNDSYEEQSSSAMTKQRKKQISRTRCIISKVTGVGAVDGAKYTIRDMPCVRNGNVQCFI